MSDPRTMDFEVWARREAKRLAKSAVTVQLLEIRPKVGFRMLGGIRMPPFLAKPSMALSLRRTVGWPGTR